MEPLPTPSAAPAGFRNLTVPLAAWLRKMGFTVTEHGWPAPTALTATWTEPASVAGPGGVRYTLDYCFVAGAGALRLVRTPAPAPGAQLHVLVEGAWVGRLKEARYLLLSSQSYQLSRQRALAASALPSTSTPA